MSPDVLPCAISWCAFHSADGCTLATGCRIRYNGPIDLDFLVEVGFSDLEECDCQPCRKSYLHVVL